MTNADQQGGGRRRALTGIVTSKSGAKTVSVAVNTLVRHPTYGKYMRRRSRLAVHDPSDAAGVGDLVEVVQCRRISKTKSWRLVRVVRKVAVAAETPGEEGSLR